jgi:prevent-host-death family protein
MSQMVSMTDLRRRFKEMMDRVIRRREPLILTRANRPEAALIPYDDFVRFQNLQESEMFKRFDAVLEKMEQANARYSDEEIESDLLAAETHKN